MSDMSVLYILYKYENIKLSIDRFFQWTSTTKIKPNMLV